MHVESPERPPGTGPWPNVALSAALIALVAIVFSEVRGFPFVSLDDPLYVTENPWVKRGLSGDGIAWAFTAFHASNWHPLTWLSHMADVELFGLDAGWHHLVNVLLHGANTLLLFAFFARTTGSAWRSALVAALFAIHPLHVESVAWVAERKDVLSTLLWIALLHVHASYARRPSVARMALSAALLATGLLAKPMLVSAPLTLLLVDVWPLRRWTPGTSRLRDAWPLVREKVPLFAVAAASCVVTWIAQARGGAVAEVAEVPFGLRLANAVLSYALYLRDTIWPGGLAAFYPHPATTRAGISVAAVLLAAVFLAVITAAAILLCRRKPVLAVGWAWYLVTLVPVIGLVQVGAQGRADRYTYVPLIGIFAAFAWLLPQLEARAARVGVGIAVALAVLASSMAARAQVSYWRDDVALYTRAISVTRENAFAWGNLGVHHLTNGDPVAAVAALERAVALHSRNASHWLDLGAALRAAGRLPDAAAAFARAAQLRPESRDAHFQLGVALLQLGQPRDAVPPLQQAVSIDARHAGAWAALAVASGLAGDADGSRFALARVEALAPALAAQVQAQLATMRGGRR